MSANIKPVTYDNVVAAAELIGVTTSKILETLVYAGRGDEALECCKTNDEVEAVYALVSHLAFFYKNRISEELWDKAEAIHTSFLSKQSAI